MNDEAMFGVAERALADFRREVKAMPPDGIDLLAVERKVQELLNAQGVAVMREAMARADTDAPEVMIEGERWGNRRVIRGTYTTMFGDVGLERSAYQKSGRGRVAVPMELRLGIVEGRYTPRVARTMTQAVALMPESDAERFLTEIGVAQVSVSTLHRVPRAIGARYEARRRVVEPLLREADPIPAEAVTIQVSLDGVMVPQDGEYAGARGRKTEHPQPPRHEQRYGAPEEEPPADSDQSFGRSWHEAGVGTVAFFDIEGRRLKTTYLARMPEPHKRTLVEQLEAEVGAVLAERAEMNICWASDGSPTQWEALTSLAQRVAPIHRGHQMKLADLFHVAEYLKLAATAVHADSEADAKVLATSWRETLKEKDDGPAIVIASLRYHRGKLTSRRRKDVSRALRYVLKQRREGRLGYAEALRRNYPVGTGITEAAAKTIVGTRMKRAGARFSQHGGQSIMLFRTALLSDRFDALHRHLHTTYTAQIAA
jgi:hypothetical protein